MLSWRWARGATFNCKVIKKLIHFFLPVAAAPYNNITGRVLPLICGPMWCNITTVMYVCEIQWSQGGALWCGQKFRSTPHAIALCFNWMSIAGICPWTGCYRISFHLVGWKRQVTFLRPLQSWLSRWWPLHLFVHGLNNSWNPQLHCDITSISCVILADWYRREIAPFYCPLAVGLLQVTSPWPLWLAPPQSDQVPRIMLATQCHSLYISIGKVGWLL